VAADAYIVDHHVKEFSGLYESMNTDWADQRAEIHKAINLWVEDKCPGGNDLVHKRLCGWADVVLLHRYAAQNQRPEKLRVDHRDYWQTEVNDLFQELGFVYGPEEFYEVAFGPSREERIDK